MPALASIGGGNRNKKSSSSSKNSKSSGGGNNKSSKKNNTKKKNSTKKTDTALDNFQKFLEKLFDWVEVRLDRIQRKIDLSTAKAENAIGWNSKNNNISDAMNQIAKTAADVNKVQIVRNNLGEVTDVSGVRTGDKTLINDSAAGALRYQQQANEVLNYASTSHTVKKKGKKKKIKAVISKDQAKTIRERVADGTIDISKYPKKVQEVITNYKEWFEKSQDLIKSTEELKQQYKELQQQKLDNITEHYEAWAGYADAVKQSSEATSKYLTAQGKEVNSQGQRDAYNAQLNRQREITGYYQQEEAAYRKELDNAKTVFGSDSKEYKDAQTKLAEIGRQITESKTAEIELTEALYDLDSTARGYLIDRLKAFVDKLASLVSLDEKRGTVRDKDNPNKIAHQVTEQSYTAQIEYNNLLAKLYENDINSKLDKIQKFGYVEGSDKYQELYKQIVEDENAIISLISTNIDLQNSIRDLRWKPYKELQETIETINSDLEHLSGFIREGDMMDENGQFTDLGFAQIAIIGEQMELAQKKIVNAKAAMKKLTEEVNNGVISEEKYNEELKEQMDIIQDAASARFDFQQKLADMYVKQITKENDLLQELIDKRSEALQQKKA